MTEKKVIFEDPKMELVRFEAEDIITTSGGDVSGFELPDSSIL